MRRKAPSGTIAHCRWCSPRRRSSLQSLWQCLLIEACSITISLLPLIGSPSYSFTWHMSHTVHSSSWLFLSAFFARPEFAKNGKDQITISDVMRHEDGVYTFDEVITVICKHQRTNAHLCISPRCTHVYYMNVYTCAHALICIVMWISNSSCRDYSKHKSNENANCKTSARISTQHFTFSIFAH